MMHFLPTSLGGLYAYIDPVSGSIWLQVIMAGALGALGYFFRPIVRFFNLLRGKSSAPPPDATNKPDGAEKP